jgi:hypothetical protein
MTATPGPDTATPATTRVAQTAQAVMMVRPASFGWNPQTQDSNSFQRAGAMSGDAAAGNARSEFDALAHALGAAGIEAHALEDRPDPVCPDAVFPNNWVSFHADGTVVLYPMLAPNRRLERRLELLLQLEAAGRFAVRRLVDLTHHERNGAFLEGTGSLVLDHAARVAYACLSPRTHREPLRDFCDELGYAPFVFSASDATGRPVYHTNVVLSLGSAVTIVAADNVAVADRERLLAHLSRSARLIVPIDRDQTQGFAANVLELRDGAGAKVLALSARAAASFPQQVMDRISAAVDRVVAVPVPTIEALGGGSVRCMLAEVFLPRAEPA